MKQLLESWKSRFSKDEEKDTDKDDESGLIGHVSEKSASSIQKVDISKIVPTSPKPENYINFYDVDQILETQRELIDRIGLTLGFDEEKKKVLIDDVVREYLRKIHLMPASESHHHSEFGGLFRHSLEVSLYAVNLATKHTFATKETSQLRHVASYAYPYALFIAGLLHDLGKAYYDMKLVGKESQIEFNPYMESVFGFQERTKDTGVSVRFLKNRIYGLHETIGSAFFASVLTQDAINYLTGEGQFKNIFVDLALTLSNEKIDEARHGYDAKVMKGVISKADQLSVKRYLMGSVNPYGTEGRALDKFSLYMQIVNLGIEIGVFETNSAGAPIQIINKDKVLLITNNNFIKEMAELIQEVGVELPRSTEKVKEFFDKSKAVIKYESGTLTEIKAKFGDFSLNLKGYLMPMSLFSSILEDLEPIQRADKKVNKQNNKEKNVTEDEPKPKQTEEAEIKEKTKEYNQNIGSSENIVKDNSEKTERKSISSKKTEIELPSIDSLDISETKSKTELPSFSFSEDDAKKESKVSEVSKENVKKKQKVDEFIVQTLIDNPDGYSPAEFHKLLKKEYSLTPGECNKFLNKICVFKGSKYTLGKEAKKIGS